MHANARTERRRRLLGLSLTLLASCSLGVAAARAQADSARDTSFVEKLLSYGWSETRRADTDGTVPLPERKPSVKAAAAQSATRRIAAVAVPAEAMRAPLTDRDAALYKKIFAAQEDARWLEADDLIAQIEDKRLLGHVLYQRYMHPTGYRARFEELKDWLKVYADHPGAQRLYAIAVARMPSGESGGLRRPVSYKRLRVAADERIVSGEARPAVLAALAPGAGLEDQGVKASSSGWMRGMSAWRNADYEGAAKHFESAAKAEEGSDWTRAAAAFWASRAHMRAGNLRQVSPWLRYAAQYPRTFYGLIATRALGESFPFNWSLPAFTGARYDKLAALPQGARAIALVAAGRQDLAEAELRMIDPGDDGSLREAMLSFAAGAKIPSLAMELGHAIPSEDGGTYDAALYPLMPWQPKDGFKVDPALIHAIMRQESKFDPRALSHKGARGLMQIMPGTARHVVQGRDLPHDHSAETLGDPLANIEIGQHYIEELLDQRAVDRDLLSLAIAYNAGPGNLSRWKARFRHVTDPLLFIESIPVSETRIYVERVLANYWIYKLRMGQPVPTLDAVAAGQWARTEGPSDSDARGFFRFWN